MLNNLIKTSNVANGQTATPKMGNRLPATLAAKPGSLNFHQLVRARLGAANQQNRVINAELRSITKTVQNLKLHAAKTQKPLAFQFNSKSFGKVTFEIDPARNQLKIKFEDKQLETSELLVAQLAPLFNKIESEPAFGFNRTGVGSLLSVSDGSVALKSARVFLAEHLGQKIENVDIRLEGNSKNGQVKSLTGQFKLSSKLSPSEAIQNIHEAVQSVSGHSTKPGQYEVQIQMKIANLGEITVEVSQDAEEGRVLLKADSPQAKDAMAKNLARSGLIVKEIKAGENKGALNLKPDAASKDSSQTKKDILKPMESTSPPALKKVADLLGVLSNQAIAMKNGSAKLYNGRPKSSTKLDKHSVQAPHKGSQKSDVSMALRDQQSKLNDEMNSVRKSLGEFLENIESDSTEFEEAILGENQRPLQPTLMNHVNLDFMGGKLVTAGPVERAQLPQMLQKILELTDSQSSPAGQRLEVQLDVEKLGSLLVDAVKQKDKINLHINVDNSEIRRILESQLRPLLEQMLKEGIEVGKLEVSVKNENTDNANAWQTAEHERELRKQKSSFEHEVTNYAGGEATLMSRQRDFGYNSIEVLA